MTAVAPEPNTWAIETQGQRKAFGPVTALRDVNLRSDAPRVACPTLLVHGAADPLMALGAAEALAALIPGAQLAVFDDCAHAPFLSRPDDFIARARDFLHD